MQIKNPEQFRENVRATVLLPILQNEEHCLNLEKGVFNWALKEASFRKVVKKWDNRYFVELYQTHLRSVYINLKNNPSLVASIGVEEGQLKPHEVAFMSHQDLMPERWSALIEKKEKEDANRYECNIQAATDTFTCRKCRSKKCTYSQLQIKSSDEGITTFVTCLDCGAKWRC
jgi:DNA-directed RNA polymerase subunit M/transcription elongation factor TFIIS